MAFKASKERKKADAEPIARSSAMHPSKAIDIWYRREMDRLNKSMIDDYAEQLASVLKTPTVERFYATDASAASMFETALHILKGKWDDIFSGFAKQTVRQFISKSDQHSETSTRFSLNQLGIEQPKMAYSKNVMSLLETSTTFNHTLITGLHQDAHESIFKAVMLSLTSPDPEQQGQQSIINAVKAAGITNKKRIKLIASDQTSKLYSALSDQRAIDNGVEEFEWMHSSAAKVPRKTHLERDGKRFKINDPRLWEGPKNDQGPPGFAINCSCRKRLVIY